MAEMRNKTGYGAKADIDQAIIDKKIDAGDYIITSDTEEFAFIKPDGTVMYPRNRNLIFESIEEAESYIESHKNTVYAGQTIIIKSDDGKYYNYTIQLSDEGGSGEFVIENGNSSESIEQAKQEAITESKNYVDSILTIVEF